ncbi:hypothetical protein CSUI_010094, partial [Cystoisospora suis]
SLSSSSSNRIVKGTLSFGFSVLLFLFPSPFPNCPLFHVKAGSSSSGTAGSSLGFARDSSNHPDHRRFRSFPASASLLPRAAWHTTPSSLNSQRICVPVRKSMPSITSCFTSATINGWFPSQFNTSSSGSTTTCVAFPGAGWESRFLVPGVLRLFLPFANAPLPCVRLLFCPLFAPSVLVPSLFSVVLFPDC